MKARNSKSKSDGTTRRNRNISLAVGLIVCNLGLAWIGYGKAWKSWLGQMQVQHVYSEGGLHLGGKVVSIRHSGVPGFRDGWIRIDNFPDEIMVPWGIAERVSTGDRGVEVDLSNLREGDEVKIDGRKGIRSQIAVWIAKVDTAQNNQLIDILPTGVGTARFDHWYSVAPRFGEALINRGLICFGIGVAWTVVAALIFLRRRDESVA